MASVDMLSDSELRTKLAEFGCPVGPVTETTRKILLKKLNHLMVQAGHSGESASGKARRSLARFSSGEEDSESDDLNTTLNKTMPPPTSNIRNSRRRSAGRMNESPSSSSAKPSRHSEINLRNDLFIPSNSSSKNSLPNETIPKSHGRYSLNYETVDRPINSSPIPNNITNRRVTRSPLNDGFDTGSDSDVPDSKMGSSRKIPGSQNNVPKNKENSSYSSSFLTHMLGARPKFLLSDNASASDSKDATSSVDTLMSFRKSLTAGSIHDAKNRLSQSFVSTPYQSNFARRLSALSSNNIPQGICDRNSASSPSNIFDVKESDVSDDDGPVVGGSPNGLYNSNSSSVFAHKPHDISQEFKTTEDEVKFWRNSQIVSMILLAFAMLFFAVLGVMYMNVRSKDNISFSPSTHGNRFPVCKNDTYLSPCIERDQVKPVVQLIRKLYPELIVRAVRVQCGSSGTDSSPIMTEQQLVQWHLDNKDDDGVLNPTSKVRNMKTLLLANPQWGLSVVSGGEDELDPEELVVRGGVMASDPVLPVTCYLRLKAYAAISSLIIIVAGFGLLYLGQFLLFWYLRHRENGKQQVYTMVERIIDLLVAHHQSSSPGGQSYVAINHVRDQLIPPPDRNRLAAVWNAAVNFLENNESRVRCEVQQVAGEEFPVWRWLPSSLTNTSYSQAHSSTSASETSLASPLGLGSLQAPRRNKVWQGQAFETMAGSPNSLPCSPTPCLKIRHMFDPDIEFGEEWPVRVKDAILEKCEGVTVLHVLVDRTSREGCVYVKCSSQEEAGKAYRALHGWWFDSNLVTVKYLRLERYHERFPDAARVTMPLQPSNNQKLSLQALLHAAPGD